MRPPPHKGVEVRAVDVDGSGDRMRAKIRSAQLEKVPYMLVVGDREVEAGQVNLRLRDGDVPGAMPIADFASYVMRAVEERRLL